MDEPRFLGDFFTFNYTKLLDVDYLLFGIWEEYGDPRVGHLPLISGGPFGVLAIVGLYLFFVFVAGPIFMKNRPPYELRIPMLAYNLSNVLMNGGGFLIGLYVTNFGTYTWGCQDPNFTPLAILFLGYGYFINKVYDFLDTVFFILRKKWTQVTALHVFHHAVMPIFVYGAMKISPTGNSAYQPLINSFIHTIMYSYYFLAAVGPFMRPYLWWKKYITLLQLIQFATLIAHSLHSMFTPYCLWPQLLSVFEFIQAIYFCYTFGSFYFASYNKKAPQKGMAMVPKHDVNSNNSTV